MLAAPTRLVLRLDRVSVPVTSRTLSHRPTSTAPQVVIPQGVQPGERIKVLG